MHRKSNDGSARPRVAALRRGLVAALCACLAGAAAMGCPTAALAAEPPAPMGLAVEIIEVFRGVGRFRYEWALQPNAHVGALIGGGSPSRSELDRFNVLEAGVHGAYFALGDRRLGAGVLAQALWRGAWGSREASFTSAPASEVRSNALLADVGLLLRGATRSGLYGELTWTARYVHSVGTARQGGLTAEDVESYPETRVALWAGWMF